MFGYSNSLVAGAFLTTLVSACSPLSSSAIRTGTMASPYAGRVRVTAVWVPPGARQLGTVQATGAGVPIEQIVPEFVQRVAELGGDVGKVDHIRTTFELRSFPVTHTYACGSPQAPSMCTSTSIQTVEVAITTIEGRAFTTRDPVHTVPTWAPPPDTSGTPWPVPQGGAAPGWPVQQDSGATLTAPPSVPPQPPQASP